MIKGFLFFILILTNFLYANTHKEELYVIKNKEFIEPKNIILNALSGINEERKALILAVASLETSSFKIDYPEGDNKSGDAYNVSIFKINRYLIKLVSENEIDESEIHDDILSATLFINHAMNVLGEDKFLQLNRGGQSYYKYDTQKYIKTVRKIQETYLNNNHYMYSGYRVTIHLNAI